jgi:hypothetical protein
MRIGQHSCMVKAGLNSVTPLVMCQTRISHLQQTGCNTLGHLKQQSSPSGMPSIVNSDP